MADKIAVIEDEYTTVESQLNTVHEQILEEAETILEELRTLSDKGGEFYTDAISPQIFLVCDELEDAKESMADIFSAHREVIRSFGQSISDLDTCC